MEEPDAYRYKGPGEMYAGRPDILAWLWRVQERRCGMDAAVNLCGPRRMINDGRKAAAAISSAMGLYHVQEEVFEL
jgi:hypothetical protein